MRETVEGGRRMSENERDKQEYEEFLRLADNPDVDVAIWLDEVTAEKEIEKLIKGLNKHGD